MSDSPELDDGFLEWLQENELLPVDQWTATELAGLRFQYVETLEPEDEDE